MGHLLVAACACVLTVAIVGSAVFLAYRVYHRHRLRTQVRAVVASLRNRSPQELAETAAQVKARPKVARFVLPEVLKSLRDSRSEQQQCSAIQVLRAFVNHSQVEKALFRLRRDSREIVAATAVAALADLEPPKRAAEVLGRCLERADAGAVGGAVVDEACAGLYRHGDAGRREMERRLSLLSVDRRVWLVGFVGERGGPHRLAWLEMLRRDRAEPVRRAAGEALQSVKGGAQVPAWPRDERLGMMMSRPGDR